MKHTVLLIFSEEVMRALQRGARLFETTVDGYAHQAIKSDLEYHGLDKEDTPDPEFQDDFASYHCEEVRGRVG